MITIDKDMKVPDPMDKFSLFSEGIIDDVLKAGGADTAQAREKWNNASDTAGQVAAVNDEIVGKMADKMDQTSKDLAKNKVSGRSIITQARRSVLQFPIYVTQTLPVHEAHVISKMFERVYADYVQAAVATHPIIDEDEVNDLMFMKRFHTNIKESVDYDIIAYKESVVNEYYQPIDELDRMLKESVFYSEEISPRCTVYFSVVPDNKDIIIENARLANEPLAGLTYLKEADAKQKNDSDDKPKNDMMILKDIKDIELTEKDFRQMALERVKLTADEKEYLDKDLSEIKAQFAGDDVRVAECIDAKHDAEEKIKDEITKIKNEISKGEFKKEGYKKVGLKYYKTSNEVRKGPAKPLEIPTLLRDNEIKKINGMKPWMMGVQFRVKDEKGNYARDINYVIGIKSIMHLIQVQDLAEDLRDIITGNIKSLRKVRYKTGEINFMDYMFNIKQLKADAAKNINYNKKWLNNLKRLGEYEKLNGSLLKKPVEALAGGSVPIPNATMILTQSDVTTLTNRTGIDLSKMKNACRLCRSLFLISLAIVDASAGSMKVLFYSQEGGNSWDVQSLAAIDSEVSKADNSALLRELNKKINM